jgi:phosphosulfolactate synthase (CoM biosynthesis protein A)
MGQSHVPHPGQVVGHPAFLDLPHRSAKPRATGLTHVIDVGTPALAVRGALDTAAAGIDLWKFGFGSAYIDPAVPEKTALLGQRDVTACIGGTLLEIAWLQDRVEACLDWAAGVGLRCVEVSNGVAQMSPDDKRRLIKRAAEDFMVVSEVGSKDAGAPVHPSAWRDEMLDDLDAGAMFALAEGRASGTVGLYRSDGSVRTELVDTLVSSVGSEHVIFEAPRTAQQVWFIRQLGSEVSLGNVAPSDTVGLEALRRGLRADVLDVPGIAPDRERVVSVRDVDVPLTEHALSALFLGREAYRRTRYVVARRGTAVAVLEVRKRSEAPLFSEITDVRLLARPEECAVVRDPDLDISVPSHLAAAAARVPDVRCVVVEGRYEYVGFILDSAPTVLRVLDVIPPEPAKLVDQVRRLLAVADDLPPILLDVECIDVRRLADEAQPSSVLFPCRASGLDAGSGPVAYLDQRPPRSDWLLVGCARSRQIHQWFYGDEPPAVDTCPRERLGHTAAPTLTRCCLIEQGIERDGATVIVPWGASLDEVRQGLVAAVESAQT